MGDGIISRSSGIDPLRDAASGTGTPGRRPDRRKKKKRHEKVDEGGSSQHSHKDREDRDSHGPGREIDLLA